jgi:hypothetical protein
MEHPTLLRRPVLDPEGEVAYLAEDFLPLPPHAYQVTQAVAWWTVTVMATGEAVYRGPGPVQVFRSPAPF